MIVSWIFRKPQPQYFSIEKVFERVAQKLDRDLELKRVYMPFHRLSISTIIRNIRFAKKDKADIYHVTGDVHYVVFGLPKKRTVLTIHDCVFMYQTGGIKRTLLYYLFLKWPVQKSDIVTTVSEKSKQDIILFTKCAPGKVVVIPDPFDEGFTYKPGSFNCNSPVILFIGITPNKNLLRVIEALDGLACRLHVIGEIPRAEKELLHKKNITYQESVGLSEEELRKAYEMSDMLLFPSLFEGFGLPIIEAQQTGRPVITSNISPVKEVAGAGACLVDPYSVASIRQGVEKLIGDERYRQQLIEKGIANAAKYKAEAIAAQYSALYQQMLVN